jgi:hypothetical protein
MLIQITQNCSLFFSYKLNTKNHRTVKLLEKNKIEDKSTYYTSVHLSLVQHFHPSLHGQCSLQFLRRWNWQHSCEENVRLLHLFFPKVGVWIPWTSNRTPLAEINLAHWLFKSSCATGIVDIHVESKAKAINVHGSPN